MTLLSFAFSFLGALALTFIFPLKSLLQCQVTLLEAAPVQSKLLKVTYMHFICLGV